MKNLLVSLLLLASCDCAHLSPHGLPGSPPAFGFFARVRAGRQIRCIIDEDLSREQCDEVGRAANKINAAVGFELLGVPVYSDMAAFESSSDLDEVTWIVGAALPETDTSAVLGVTMPQKEEPVTGYMRRLLVAYSPRIWVGRELFESVTLHELLHSVGAAHSEQDGLFASVMKPTWKVGAPTELTPADVDALRAAYGSPR
jgi:hypothetical protein